MSELTNNRDNRATIRWKLLTSASALALTAYVSSASIARAEDAGHPMIWIELGGQMENLSGQGEAFAPAFLAANPTSPVLNTITPLQAQRPPASFGEEGSISFQPEDSDWVFSAAIRIGRSSNFKHVDHQTNKIFYGAYKYGAPAANANVYTTEDFADTQVHHQEHNTILDFAVGRDVGLGIFGKDASSTVNLGVRFAQFASRETFDIRARPDMKFDDLKFPTFFVTIRYPYFHTYHATGRASRSFQGVGPSLSWNGSAPFAGNSQDGEITFDWGADVALLFGKQKARAQHQESGHYVGPGDVRSYQPVYQNPSVGHSNVRSVSVPNIGGSVGVSFKYPNFKFSLGYRYDTFLNAMDTGIDTAKKSNLTFNGPYASISVGLGD